MVKVGSSSVTTAAGTHRRARSSDAAGDEVAALRARGPHGRRRHLGRDRRRLVGPRRAAGPRPSDPAVLQAVSAVGQHRLMRAGRTGSARTACSPARSCSPRSTSSTASSTCTPAGTLVAPARARRRAGGQRERRGGRRGDPLRRQRPPGRAGGPPRVGRPARPPHRHRRAAHRRPRAARPRRRSSRRWSRSTTAGGDGRRLGQRGRQRRHGLQAGGGQDRHLVGRGDRHRRRRAPGRARRDRRGRARGRGRVFRAQRAAGSRPASSGSPSPSAPRARSSSTRGPGGRWSSGAARSCRPAWSPSRGDFGPDDAVEIARPDGTVFAKGLVRYPARRAAEWVGRRSERAPRRPAGRGRPPRRPGRPRPLRAGRAPWLPSLGRAGGRLARWDQPTSVLWAVAPVTRRGSWPAPPRRCGTTRCHRAAELLGGRDRGDPGGQRAGPPARRAAGADRRPPLDRLALSGDRIAAMAAGPARRGGAGRPRGRGRRRLGAAQRARVSSASGCRSGWSASSTRTGPT